MNQRGILVGIFCCLALFGPFCSASDTKREADFADEIAKTRYLGKMVWLEAEGQKFLGLYTETEKKDNKGAVIILHDQGGHPNQLQLIKSLRSFLPEHHWSTLSLQMPLREMDASAADYYALFPEALARIQAGINYLQDNKTETIVVAGYGLGAMMAAYAQSEKAADIKAMVLISLGVPDTQDKSAQTLEFIKKITLPMLDIYADRDLAAVIESARDRRLAAKENAAYRQVKIGEEDHLFQHDEGLVVKRIYSWIERVTANQEDIAKTPQLPGEQIAPPK
jgi:alpha/beta superfamily hydrolase